LVFVIVVFIDRREGEEAVVDAAILAPVPVVCAHRGKRSSNGMVFGKANDVKHTRPSPSPQPMGLLYGTLVEDGRVVVNVVHL
jgi:hypothetical protein